MAFRIDIAVYLEATPALFPVKAREAGYGGTTHRSDRSAAARWAVRPGGRRGAGDTGNDVIVLLAAVFVANLYVQGGMRLRHVAWFALALSPYDLIFTTVAR